MSCLFLPLPTYVLNIMISITQTLAQTDTISNQITGIYWSHNVTTGIQDFVKCCIKHWLHLDLQPDVLFGGLQQSYYVVNAEKIYFKLLFLITAC